MTPLQRMQAALSDRKLDGAIISSEINQRYLSGFSYTDGYLLITAERAFLLADFRYIEAATAQVSEFSVIKPSGTMTNELRNIIAQNRLKTIALEDASLSCAMYQMFQNELGEVVLCTGASELLKELRSVKSKEEMQKIQRAQEITDQAFTHIVTFLANRTPDMTERDVALELEFFMRKHGAESTAFPTIAVSGSASSLPHGIPRPVPLQSGFLTMDFGALYDGYCSDMTRTVVIGKADDAMKRVYQTVLSAQMLALETIHEGISCRAADETARAVIRNAGFGSCFGHSLGHGVGMYIHESPNLSPRSPESARLKRGHVVTVEPGIYLPGQYGCRIEDMIGIDETGTVHNFTHSSKELTEL